MFCYSTPRVSAFANRLNLHHFLATPANGLFLRGLVAFSVHLPEQMSD
jgi:hypothetical protein